MVLSHDIGLVQYAVSNSMIDNIKSCHSAASGIDNHPPNTPSQSVLNREIYHLVIAKAGIAVSKTCL
jgi:hypothetical protein